MSAEAMTRYVAFLRGINVGGHRPVKMADLAAAVARMGFEHVRTVQASGNVVFDSAGADPDAVAARVEAGLRETLGYSVGVLVRRATDLQALVDSDPFSAVSVTPATRLYVTFLSRPVKSRTEIRPNDNVQVVDITEGEVLTAIELSAGWGTTELMTWLEKEFGGGLTTRNWNTIARIVGRG